MRPKQPIHRVTTGDLKGKIIPLPMDKSVRPTRSSVLESGLDMLGSRLNFNGISAIDFFTGSGQWGIELLSRGAEHVSFIDAHLGNLKGLLGTFGEKKGKYKPPRSQATGVPSCGEPSIGPS